MTQMPTLETKRLLLRPFAMTDAKEVQRLAGDWAIADTTLTIPHPYGDGVAEEWIATHQQTFDQEKGVTLAITRKSDGVLLGAIALLNFEKGHQAEIGYWVGKPYWGQGHCTEAAGAMLRYGFINLDLIRIHARYITRNPASGRVMQKLGMRHEGCRRQHATKWGKFDDVELYGILKCEWEER
jgi:[ribosomal protein S5]-alanine N-acetyltransferase